MSLDLDSEAPNLIGGSWLARFDYAASILYVHGLISRSERYRIHAKLTTRAVRAASVDGRRMAETEGLGCEAPTSAVPSEETADAPTPAVHP